MTFSNSLSQAATAADRLSVCGMLRLGLGLIVAYAATLTLQTLFPSSAGISLADNVLLTISMITAEALRVLENNLTFTKQVSRQFDDRYAVEGAKIGTVLNVRKPPRYVGRTGQALQVENAVETSVPVTLNTQFGVDLQFSSQDLALSIDDFSNRFLTPALATVANKIDYDGLQLYSQIYQAVGTPGTVPASLLVYLNSGVMLNNSAAPMDGKRSQILNPQMEATLVNALTGLFQSASAISEQYMKGKMGIAIGFNFYMDQNVAVHTVGTYGGTPLVNGASQSGNSLITDGWTVTTTTLNVGDIYTIAGVYGVNPQSRQSTGALMQFVVTDVTTTDGSGNSTIAFNPAIVASGAFQNVTNVPADNAAITVFGASTTVTPQGMAMHQDAFTLACADLPLPNGVDMAARMSDKQLGLSIRMIRAYDIQGDMWPCRLDILYGWAVLRPELACRVAS